MPRPPTRQSLPLLAVFIAALIAVLAPPASADPSQPTPDVQKSSVLSPRLEILADPDVAALPAPQQADAVGAEPSGPGGLITSDGAVSVQVQLASLSPSSLSALNGVADSVTVADEALGLVDVLIQPQKLPALASVKGVVYASENISPVSNAACPTGTVTEGDQVLRAAEARAAFGVDGSGVKVGILSDSYNSLGGAPSDVAGAEQPGPGNPCGQSSAVSVIRDYTGTDEGRAMAQIVHDIAPGAQLLFATASPSPAAFASNIRALAAAGAKVIVDDITYFTEPMYQDGVIAAAIADVTAQGVTYFSSAGNSNLSAPASYEAMSFRPTQCPAAISGYSVYAGSSIQCHDFNGGSAVKPAWSVTASGSLQLAMSWNEPAYGVSTDLDLCIVNRTTQAVVTCGYSDNIASRQATEWAIGGSGSLDVVVVKAKGAQNPRFKIVTLSRNLSASDVLPTGGDVVGPTAFGHNVSEAAISVGAQAYNQSTVEAFSSRGPATTCWGPVVGSTSAAKLSSCRVHSIDLTATDGGLNSFFGGKVTGGYRFYGTSAAAPHAAGVAALLSQAWPGAKPADIAKALTSTAVPVYGASADSMGAGRVDAYRALESQTVRLSAPEGSSYTAVTPMRVLDTRDGTGGRSGALGPGQRYTLTIPGLPADVTAVVLNVTAVSPPGSGFLTVYPGGTSRPAVSNLNFVAGDIVPNLVTVRVGANGTVAFEPGVVGTHVVADLAGYYSTASSAGYVSTAPSRVLDTRQGLGIGAALPAGATRTLTISNLPAGTTAVTLNVTAVQPTGTTFVTVFPAGVSRPLASNLNLVPGDVRANLVTVPVGPGGKVSFFNSSGSTDLVADLAGYYTTAGGSQFFAMTPTRIVDTRSGIGGPAAPITHGGAITVPTAQIPAGASAIVYNMTAVGPTAAGYLTAWPSGNARPVASNLNFRVNEVVPNLSQTAVASTGSVSVFNPMGSTHVVIDLAGYFA